MKSLETSRDARDVPGAVPGIDDDAPAATPPGRPGRAHGTRVTDLSAADHRPGVLLASARVRAGLTLAEVARRSRVPIDTLRALEADDWASVPADVYCRGFLRLFAVEVGLDADLVISRYMHHRWGGETPGATSPRTVTHSPASGRRDHGLRWLLAAAVAGLGVWVWFSTLT